MSAASQPELRWHPERPRLRPLRLVISWVISALSLLFAALVVPNVTVSGFWGALGIAALIAILNALVPPVIAALRLPFTLITILAGMDDDDEYTLRVTRRIARRSGNVQHTDVPGVIYLEIDGLGLPVLQRAMRDG